jgi:sulfur relay protein TusB/DsrH
MKVITLINPDVNAAELAAFCQPDDCLLLRQDAVYLLLQQSFAWPAVRLCALQADMHVRQLDAPAGVEVINEQQWVQLIATAEQHLLWH